MKNTTSVLPGAILSLARRRATHRPWWGRGHEHRGRFHDRACCICTGLFFTRLWCMFLQRVPLRCMAWYREL